MKVYGTIRIFKEDKAIVGSHIQQVVLAKKIFWGKLWKFGLSWCAVDGLVLSHDGLLLTYLKIVDKPTERNNVVR